ncbi:MAG TPA: trehalose-phosphatase [Candidatus Bathyarchaeia archaeon]|nr:trehalose-phosphatase [Candidatus Bathyarchaeia archaeon]
MAIWSSTLHSAVCPQNGPADPAELARTIARDARSRRGLLLFADFDAVFGHGDRKEPRAKLPLLMRGALVALATTPDTRVVVSSGEDASDLETYINVPGVVYAGCRGLQIRGGGMMFSHPVAARSRDLLPLLARELLDSLAPLPGVEVEIKEFGVGVHVRDVDPDAVPVIVAQAEELIRTLAPEFRVWSSESTVDVFPDVDWRMGSSVLWILGRWMCEREGCPVVVYLGSGDTDEETYGELKRYGYAIRVGRPGDGSASSHWVADQTAAVDLLGRLAFTWSVQSHDRERVEESAGPAT